MRITDTRLPDIKLIEPDVFHKTTDYWCRDLERGLRWDDPKIGIVWPGGVEPILAEKDRDNPELQRP
ncbi:MAG: dTDP-4-dehydrorhamnose 3,5-epimerase family protein [Corticimicrobacter sp.]|uniref:dTDP-4-dehydrorhamnose 3,5-epimerase family protein n=1 Tax=Corticimicrobacter sp. TaxID=2678536 RepID=UPI0032DA54C6